MIGAWPGFTAVILVLLAVQALGPNVTKLTLAGLAFWAFGSPRHSVQALSLVWIFGLLNPELVNPESRFNLQFDWGVLLLKWAVLLAAALRCLIPALVARRLFSPVSLSVTLFVAVVGAAATVTSALPDVSLTKLASFWLGSVTIIVAFESTVEQARLHHHWFMGLAAALVAANVVLLFFPDMYLAYGQLFRGLFYNPQQTGVVMAVAAAWLIGRCFVERRLPVAAAVLACGACIVLWQTDSRTAVLGLLLAFVVAAGLRLVSRQREPLRLVLRPGSALFLALTVIVGAVWGGDVVDSVARFVQKRDFYYGLKAELWTSRQHFIRNQLKGFSEAPVFGNGFGVASDTSPDTVIRDPVTSIALSSATEKGFLATAVLEETGVVGAALWLLIVIGVYRRVMRVATFPRLWMAVTAGAVNLGESVFFSFGGVGMFLWLVLGLALLPEPHADA